MKTKTALVILLVAFTGFSYSTSAQVGIGTTNPDNAAALDITATDKGLLPPRMSEAERDNINTPPAGLMVWCTNCGGGEMQVYNGTDWTNMTGGAAATAPPQVGDFAEGGVVFYIFQDGDPGYVAGETHGLVCEIEDQSASVQYGPETTTGATGTGIGTGQANTTTIIDSYGTGTYAASVCNNHSVTIDATTYDDWFLPSRDELELMKQNKTTINATALANNGSSFEDLISDYYWSSTETASFSASRWSFNTGLIGVNNAFKTSLGRVRAVRAF